MPPGEPTYTTATTATCSIATCPTTALTITHRKLTHLGSITHEDVAAVRGRCLRGRRGQRPQSSRAAELVDIIFCYSGTSPNFHDRTDALPAASWSQNGIIMRHAANKMLDNAVVHCEGVQRGTGPERTGYGLCKIVDGDMIIAEFPYNGFNYDVRFLDGTGKWEGIKGSLHSARTHISKPGRGAMPGTYQGCRREKGSFSGLVNRCPPGRCE
jgi:hypothetical protein